MLVFLFTDIEGSTRLWEEHTPAMASVIARHDEILRAQIEACGGLLTKHTGDGVTAAFEGGEPLTCALEAQRRFAREPWGAIGELRIRVGLHAGAAEWLAGPQPGAGDYHGPPVNATARVMSAAWGGQILLTPEVTAVSALPEGATVHDLGHHLLKNVSAPQQLYQLLHPKLIHTEFPPPRTLSGQAIREAVAERGAEMARLKPTAMGVRLLAVTLAPALQGELDPEAGALEGSLGVLEELGALSLRRFLAAFAARLGGDAPVAGSQLQAHLQDELQAQWQAGGETALALRADASRLLQAVQGVEGAMVAATGEVKEALARGLADLGGQFAEFRWMLGGVQAALAEMRSQHELQLSLQREQLAKTEEILRFQREQVDVPVADQFPVTGEPPAFLAADGERFEQPVFVARERELAQLDGLLQAALAGQGRILFVAGGPGRGKTALLTEFARRAMEAHPDLLVASGSCNAFSGRGDPYLPFREVMAMLSGDVEARWLAGQITTRHARRLWGAVPAYAQALLARGPDVLGAFVQGDGLLARAATAGGAEAPWLAALRNAVERQQARRQGSTRQGVEQSHLFEQYTNVLRQVGERHPVLLILDDLQWADSASLDMLFHLGRRLQGAPILIACAYRPEEVALGRPSTSSGETERHPLDKVLSEFKRLYGDVCLDLGREDEAADRGFVDALLDTEPHELGEGFRRALFEHTGGHPLFAIELLRDLQERGDLIRNERGSWVEGPNLSWESLPARVEGVIEERIGRLEEDLREALSVASVEGAEFTAQVVARIQEVQERRLLRQLSRELEKRHRLVLERGEDRVGRRTLSRYRFAHALFQQYLYNDLGAGERRLLHGEVADVLAELFEGKAEAIAVQLAFHYCRAGMEERALPHLVQAGHLARARFANEEAVSYYTEALQLTPQDSPERFDLLAARAAVYDVVARRDEQRADAEEMVDLAEVLGDEVRLCDALLALAGYHLETQLVDAREPAEKALRIARELGDPLRQGQALRHLGELHWFTSDYPQSREELEAAIELLLEAGAPGEAASGLHMLSLALGDLYELGPAIEVAKESIALSQEAGDRRQEATAVRRLALAYMNRNRYAEALPFARRALALHREVGDRDDEASALNVLGIILAQLGEIEEGERCLWQSLSIGQSIGSSILIGYAAMQITLYHHTRRGDFEGCLQFVDTLLEDAKAREDDWLWAWLLWARGNCLLVLGQYDRAYGTYDTAAQRMEKLGDLGSALWRRAWSGLAQACLGDHEGSSETLRTVAERARESGNDHALGAVLVLWGLAGLLEGSAQTLRAGLERALEGLDLVPKGDTWMTGFSSEIAAALHLAAGEIDGAMEYSSEGLRVMESDPAPWCPERKHFTHSRILRALGRDVEADEHLARAHACVMRVAGNTHDPELKQSWLENVEVNREILAAAAERGIGE